MEHSTQFAPTTINYWRIVLALATKDIVDALKNKTTLTMVLGLAMMMVTVEALPLLLKLDDRPRIAIYDAARSSVADELRRQGNVQVLEMRHAEDALSAPVEASGPLLALTFPTDWEAGTGPLTVEAYLGHGVGSQEANRLIDQAERALHDVTGREITLRTDTVYPTLESGGHTVMVAMGLVLATVLITTILVPYLILEEKTTHTLDLLRVSPITVNQMLLGKGLAGLVYGVLTAIMLLALNLSLVNLWGLLLPAILALILFGIGLGLLVGILVENEGTVQMWVGLVAILLLFPVMLLFFGSDRLPAWVQSFVRWLPTTATFDLVRLSFGNVWTPAEVLSRLVAVMIATVFVFAAAGWRLRSWEG